MRRSFRDAALAAYDKEVADLRKDLERAIDRGEFEKRDQVDLRIQMLPKIIKEQA